MYPGITDDAELMKTFNENARHRGLSRDDKSLNAVPISFIY